jgi:hypothetical protein
MSARELNAHIKDLKVEYGFSKPVSEKTANKTSDDSSSSPADGKKIHIHHISKVAPAR